LDNHVSLNISEENIPLKIKRAFVILVPGYTATRWNLAVELLLLLLLLLLYRIFQIYWTVQNKFFAYCFMWVLISI